MKTKETNMLTKTKYYTVQNGKLIKQHSANEAQYAYSKNKDVTLIEEFPNKAVLLFKKYLKHPVSCDNINDAFLLSLKLNKRILFWK